MAKRVGRREFLRLSTMAAAGAAAVACQPQTVVVKETVEVEKEKLVKETVVVEKEKVVKETVEVKKEVTKVVEKLVTATPEPVVEAPMLEELVRAGKLPPVEDRLAVEPYVAKPTELYGWKGTIGKYGGSWRLASKGPGDGGFWARVVWTPKMLMWGPDYANGEIRPGYASSWDISPDGRSFTFHIRKGIKWSDGTPFTTADIQWWYDNHFLHEDLMAAYWDRLRQGEDRAELNVTDDFTFTFTFKHPNGLFLWQMCTPEGELFVRPSHYMKQFHAASADAETLDQLVKKAGFENWVQLYQFHDDNWEMRIERPMLYPWMVTNPVGEGTQVIWERHPYFWMVDEQGQQLPYIDKLVATVHQAMDTMVLAAIAGEVDNQARHIATPANLPMLKQNQAKGGYRLTEHCSADGPTEVAYCLSMTTEDPVKRELFRSKEFKLALSHAVNREELWNLIFKGAVAFDGPEWDSPLQQDEVDKIYEDAAVYDVDLANRMLDELGLTERDRDGYRLMKDGRRLSILVEHAITYPTGVQVSELVAQDWKKVGVEAIVKAHDRPLFQEKRENDECELCRHGDPGVGAAWAIDRMVDARMDVPVMWEADYGHKWYTWYVSGGKDPNGEEPPEDVKKALALYDEMKRTPDFDKQVELYKQIILLRAQGFWWIDLGPYWAYACNFSVTKNDMQNVPPRMPDSWSWCTPGPSQTWMYYFDPPRQS